MKAKILPTYDTNRKYLKDIIPIKTPFTIFIEPTRLCNFKCFYCMHSTKNKKNNEFKKTGYEIKDMDLELYEKILNDIKGFPDRPKRIVFSGLGEPLINKNLPHMIARAKELNIADRLDILTNASLLNKNLIDEIVNAGVTRIQISLQGLNSEKYKEISDVDIDFDTLYSNLKYLYKNKGNCTIFIKIIDSILDSEHDKNLFFEMFGDICDQIFVEHLITLQQQMGDHDGKADDTKNINNEKVIFREVCPVIFYIIQIDVDGNIFPCPVSGLPSDFSLGNIKKDTLLKIWEGKSREYLIKEHLSLKRMENPVCSKCQSCACVLHNAEFLDDVAKELLQRFK